MCLTLLAACIGLVHVERGLARGWLYRDGHAARNLGCVVIGGELKRVGAGVGKTHRRRKGVRGRKSNARRPAGLRPLQIECMIFWVPSVTEESDIFRGKEQRLRGTSVHSGGL